MIMNGLFSNDYGMGNNYGLYPMINNPMFMQQAQQQQPNRNPNVIYALVSGLENAKEYSIPPGNTGVLFDNESNEFYIKKVDRMGMQNLRKYEYKEVEIPSTSSGPAISDSQEVEDLKKRISMLEGIIAGIGNSNTSSIVPEEKKRK